MRSYSLLVGAIALFTTPTTAQTWTACNPTNSSLTCPNDPAFGTSHNFIFNASTTVTDSYNITAGALTYDSSNGAGFTINQKGDSPTIQSKWYIFFGSVSVIMKAATGQGVISSIVLESDDLDEIDWEFMGGNGTHAETNYFGKGNQSVYDRAFYYPVSSDLRENFHNYTLDWTAERLQWLIDGNVVRTLPYAAAYNGQQYPQTPMTVRMGIWAGGDAGNKNGTIEWAGGLVDYSKGPYTMNVQSALVTDYSSGKEYTWSDHSGSFQSIKSIAGNSTALQTINAVSAPPPLTMAQKWAALPPTTKIAIYAGSGAAGVLIFCIFLFTCIRQRRAGKKEREEYNARVEKEREDAYKEQMAIREKGLGGWDQGAYASQGEDALGGWGGTHVPQGEAQHVLGERELPKEPSVSVAGVPTSMRNASPTLPQVSTDPRSQRGSPPLNRSMTNNSMASGPANRGFNNSPAPINRNMNMSPALIAPQARSPRWNGGNEGGLIGNAGNAYNGGFNGGYGGGQNIPRSPSYNEQHRPMPPPQQQRGYGGYSNANQGYQAF